MDPEHNFLVHLEGTKCMTLFDKSDRRIVSDEDIERTYTQGHRKLKFDPGLEQYATRFELQPGQALHVPISAPHYVINGDAPCISLSVTFATPRTMRRGRILKVNHHLRKLGLSPSPPEQRIARDAFKSALGSVYQGARSLIGGH